MAARKSARSAAARPRAEAAESPETVQIGLLGRMSVTAAGADVTPRGPTQRRLIAALAVAALRRARLPTAELVDAVYADQLPPRARRSLATLVWRLRKKWGAQVIDSDPYGYWLVADRCVIDAAQFEALLLEGSALDRAGERAAATTTFERGLSMWHGGEDLRSYLPAAEADRLVELRLGAMERLAELLLGDARPREAIELLEPVAAQRPDWEHSQALLIACHLDLGTIADAHRVGDRARRALIDQGIDPGPELSRAIGRLAEVDARAHPSAATPERALPAVRTAASRPSGAADVGQPADLHRPAARAGGPAAAGSPVTGESGSALTRPDRLVTDTDAVIGRIAERAQVVEVAATALRTRTPSVVAVTGEAGIGKSMLVRAALAGLRDEDSPPRTMTLQCDPRRTLPYAVFAPLVAPGDQTSPLARLLGGDATAEPAVSTDVLHQELTDRLRAVAAPTGLVLVVEDLHWAPPGTTDALAALLDLAGSVPMAALVTTRHRTVPRQLAPWTARRIRLDGLGTAAVAELIGTDAEQAATMRRLTGGNPLYIRQLHQGGQTDAAHLPDDLRAAIDAHLQMVPTDVLAALRIAAAVGDEFSLMTLAALTGPLRQELPTWRERLRIATAQGLVRDVPHTAGGYEFVHTLIREHLYAQLRAEEQTRVHAQIGRALRRLTLSRPCPADLLAHHYMRGWPQTSTAEVVEHLTAAAQAATAQLDFTQASSHYRSALDYRAMDPELLPEEDTARLLGAAAGACAAAGQTRSANELYRSQLRLATSAGMPRWQMFASLGALRMRYARRAGPGVTDDLVAAVTAACEREVIADEPELTGEALAAIQVYRPALAATLLTTTTDLAPTIAGRLRTAVWEHQSVRDQLATARLLVQDPGADPVGSWLRLWVSEVAAGQRALDDEPRCPVPLTEADDRTRFDLTQWRITVTIATGRAERAHRMIDEALAAPAHPDPAENARRAASFYGQRTYLALLTGDRESAQRSPLLANPAWASRHPIMRYVGTYMRTLAGDPAAREECEDLVEEIRDEVIPDSDIVPRLLLLSGICLRTGHDDGLEPCLVHLLRHRGEHGIFRFGQYWGGADGTIGDLQAALGDLDAAIESYRGAEAGYEAVHAHRNLPGLRRALAETLERRARPEDLRLAGEVRRRSA